MHPVLDAYSCGFCAFYLLHMPCMHCSPAWMRRFKAGLTSQDASQRNRAHLITLGQASDRPVMTEFRQCDV